MAWCRQTTSHYVNQCWTSLMASLGHSEFGYISKDPSDDPCIISNGSCVSQTGCYGDTFHKAMMTSSNGNIFRVTGPLCREFTGHQRNFDVFFDLHLNKRLSKQSWGWWFETPSCSVWLHCYKQPFVTRLTLPSHFKSRVVSVASYIPHTSQYITKGIQS